MTRHYLDHASTSPLRPEAVAAMAAVLGDPGAYGDPGRLHEEGTRARAAIEGAREEVAAFVGVAPRQVVFTSGATEAANAASWGGWRATPGAAFVCTAVEHSCITDSARRLGPVEAVPVDGDGRVDAASFAKLLDARLSTGGVAMAHCQLANHEVGTIQPVAAIAEECRRRGVLLHVDAAAAGGGIRIHLGDLGADLLSLSAHKLGGPPGVGALVLARGIRIEPFVAGGAQERGRRGGMENLPAIAGFGAVARTLAGHGEREADRLRSLIDGIVEASQRVSGVTVVGPGDALERVPHIACLIVEGVLGEPVLLGLEAAGVAVHSGSACSSESLEPSPVLEAMGLDPDRSLRLSVGWNSSASDVEAFAGTFPAVVERLRGLRR